MSQQPTYIRVSYLSATDLAAFKLLSVLEEINAPYAYIEGVVYAHLKYARPWFAVTSEMAPGELHDFFRERGFSR